METAEPDRVGQIEREVAEQVRDHILEAVKHITLSVRLIDDRFPLATLDTMRRAARLAIGTLDTVYLAHIFELYPDLDDLPPEFRRADERR